MKQDLWFNKNRGSVNLDWINVYVIQSKNGVMRNVGVNVNNTMICFEKDHILNSNACDSNKACKTVEYLDTKSCSCQK